MTAWGSAADADAVARTYGLARTGPLPARPPQTHPSIRTTSFSLVRLLEAGCLGGSGGETGPAWGLLHGARRRAMADRYDLGPCTHEQAFLSSSSSNEAGAGSAGKPNPLPADFSPDDATPYRRDAANPNFNQAFLSSGSSNEAQADPAGKPDPLWADFSGPAMEECLASTNAIATERCTSFSLVRLLE